MLMWLGEEEKTHAHAHTNAHTQKHNLLAADDGTPLSLDSGAARNCA